MTLTITAKDANGKPVADGSRAVIASPTSNVALGGTVSATTTLLGGVATQTLYAPATSGDFLITAVSTATGTPTRELQGLSVEGDQSSSLALDAANAATDAANNAYDEAQNATQAASDALAAVTELAAQVTSLIASVKKLTAAVAKLSKKK